MSNDEEMVDEMVRELYPLIIEELHPPPTDNSSTIFTIVILLGSVVFLPLLSLPDTKKERRRGFFLGFMLGPIGILIALLIPSKKKIPDTLEKCPLCGETITMMSLPCPSCGLDLTDPDNS